MAQMDEIDKQRRKFLIPKFSFLNDFGKDIMFRIANESYSECDEFDHNYTIQAGEYIEGNDAAL